MMKKNRMLIFIVAIFMVFAFCFCSFAEPVENSTKNVATESTKNDTEKSVAGPSDLLEGEDKDSSLLGVGGGVSESFSTVFEFLSKNILPFIPIFIVLGSVAYFLTGVRSKEKRQKGVGMMIAAMVIYLVFQLVPFIRDLMDLNAFEGFSVTAYEVTHTFLKEASLLSLPITTFCIVTGYIIANTVGARNMQKKRVGDTLVIGSIIFLVVINAMTFVYPFIFSANK